jgi:type VI secretion system protein ImpK
MQEEIANLVHPVLACGLRLKERLQQGDKPLLDVEQATLKGLLLSEAEARRWTSFGGEAGAGGPGELAAPGAGRRGGEQQFLGIRYALVCWLDELFTLDSPLAGAWNERKLEVALYGTNDRAWKFWDQARRAETLPERTQVRGQQWDGPAELDPPTRVPPLHGREKLQRMVLTGGVALLVLIPILAFFVVRQPG